jgi:hypothetical protein
LCGWMMMVGRQVLTLCGCFACRCVCHELPRHSDKISLARGMGMTGGIITAAGVIMAIAFGALIFSETPALNEIGELSGLSRL